MRQLKIVIPILLFLTVQYSAVGQSDTIKINELVNQLSWKSISKDCVATMLMLTHEDSTVKALVKIGKPATNKLIAALDNTSMTVIAHIILTQIWGDNKSKYYFSEKYIYKDCNQLVGTHYTYNGLVWEWYSGREDVIRQSEVDKIKKYWTAKLIDKKTVSIDLAKIASDLDKQDNLLYPCNKIYENNATDIKFQNLYILLNKKSDDSLFEKLWKKFGNDSTVSVYDDCFFITYSPEGLSFRFEKDSTLSTIFVDNSYKGELPYKLKLTDLKPIVENKIGKPFKSGKYVDNTWNWYKDKSLYLDFDKKGKIIKFGISKT
ncbi:MAG: hypothetical protein QM802_05385 [Agriterribacter sp.]